MLGLGLALGLGIRLGLGIAFILFNILDFRIGVGL